jgi:hypothetical protein
METPELTFASLDEKIEEAFKDRSNRTARDWRPALGAGLITIAGLATLLLAKALPHYPKPWVILLLAAFLLVEVVGLILSVPKTLSDLVTMTPGRQRRELASDMDLNMPHYQGIVAWLRKFPRERLQGMGEYAAFRLDRYRSKMPAFTGSIDKLGALPVLAAIAIQFKDASWPPQISWWQIALFAVLAWFYWMSVLLINLRFRVELYDALLKKALT